MEFSTKWTSNEAERLYVKAQEMYQELEVGPVKDELLSIMTQLYVYHTVPVVIMSKEEYAESKL